MAFIAKIDFASIKEPTKVWQSFAYQDSGNGPCLMFMPSGIMPLQEVEPSLHLVWDDQIARSCGHAEELSDMDAQTMFLVLREYWEYKQELGGPW